MIIKCSRCGFINKSDANFCIDCGNNLHEGNNNTSSTSQNSSAENNNNSNTSQNNAHEDNNTSHNTQHEENQNTNTPQNNLEWFLDKISNNEINLPTNDCPVILKRGEEPIVVLPNLILREPQSVRTSYGSYGGPTVRLMKGVSFRLGGASHTSSSHDEIKIIDKGTLTITNKRLIFTGSMKTLNYNLSKILSITEFKDAIGIQKENKQKIEYYTNCDNLRLDYEIDGRTRSIPFYGCLLKAAILSQLQ